MDLLSEKAQSVAGHALSVISDKSHKKKQNISMDEGTKAQSTSAVAVEIHSNQRGAPRTTRHARGAFGGDSHPYESPPPIGFSIRPSDVSNERVSSIPRAESDPSLYEGNTWSKLWFQRLMLLSLIRVLVFIRKLYEDFHATKAYRASGQIGYFIVAALTLFLPTIIFTTYRLCRYLQGVLPSLRPINDVCPYPNDVKTHGTPLDQENSSNLGNERINNQDEMDGLVTARQTPVPPNSGNEEEFHDSKSQLESKGAQESAQVVQRLMPATESVQISKLGDIPDKDTTRVVIGSSEQILHGVLFIFWQIKRQVDVIGYLVERSCLWRKPSNDEIREIELLRTGSDGLEWFQDFYAAFLAILIQVYTLGIHWKGDSQYSGRQLVPSGLDSVLASHSTDELAVSNAAKAVSEVLTNREIVGSMSGGHDLLILSELLVSSAVIASLLIAVRRKDDGPLTLGLSMLGWGAIFASRIIIIALAFVHVGWVIMASLVMLHTLGVTIWIYKIAVDSHNQRPSENETLIWERESESEMKREGNGHWWTIKGWSTMEHLILLIQIYTLFALPSLFYWPIMFNLRFHCRPLKYLVVILTENFLLIPAVWFSISAAATLGQWYLLGAVGAFSIVGFIFVFLYVSCKPTLTDYFARADHIFNAAEQSGIYFEFCSRVFKMPNLEDIKFKRLMRQTEELEAEEEPS